MDEKIKHLKMAILQNSYEFILFPINFPRSFKQ